MSVRASSFYWPLRLLGKGRRSSLFAIYAFCRAVDDVADDEFARDATPVQVRDVRLARLGAWRREIARVYQGHPRSAIGRALIAPVRRYGLARRHFDDQIAAQEMDVCGLMRAPSTARLDLYCRRAAASVGHLAIAIMGAEGPAARTFADALGSAMQRTNILRDLAEDAVRGRLYLPDELLAAAGIATRDPMRALAHPALAAACARFALCAHTEFETAQAAYAAARDRRLGPARAMMAIYARLLERLEARGWGAPATPIAVPQAERLWLALRHGRG